MGFKQILEDCPVIASAHLFAGHCKKDNLKFDQGKSYFVDVAGAELSLQESMKLLGDLKQKATQLTAAKSQEDRKIDGPPDGPKALHKLRKLKSSKAEYIAFAFTDGTRVGTDSDGESCMWMCFVVTKNKTGGRHQWVTCYPATEAYVMGKLA